MSRVRRSRSPKVLKFQKLILPIIILLIVIAIVVVILFIDTASKEKIGIKTYQFDMTERVEFDESSEVILQKSGIVVSNGGDGYELDSTPLYAMDTKTAYLTKDMSWSEPEGICEWAVESFSSVKIDENDLIVLTTDGKDYYLEGGFLHDNGKTYVFLDDVKLKVDGDIYNLSPLSFYSGENGVIRIYDYASDNLSVVEGGIYKAEITCDKGYTLDLISGIMTGPEGTVRILAAAPLVLQNISER